MSNSNPASATEKPLLDTDLLLSGEKPFRIIYSEGFKTQAMKVQDRRIAAEASGLFWQMVEPSEHELMAACDRKSEGWTEDTLPALLRRYRAMVLSVYDEFCPHDTARQFEAWVLNRPFSRRKDG